MLDFCRSGSKIVKLIKNNPKAIGIQDGEIWRHASTEKTYV